ncbi:type II secretion system protein GspJ [Sphingomonas montana]|uniref:type II secretion system protein GspJ n=1 Tax=Sphingomonas montana TaxID=1843236 RepID=UPI00096D15FB|nr:type II secretion system protein GspJ [Sphingomonas montana]
MTPLRRRDVPAAEQGFTLIELIVSLALFGLIAVAGLALVENVLGVQAQTDGRLERLGDLQRAMFVVTSDLEQVSEGAITGSAAGVAFRRHAQANGGYGAPVAYTLVAGALTRTLMPVVPGEPIRSQRLLDGVSAARWRYRDGAAGWRDSWPPAEVERQGDWPDAIDVTLVLTPGRGRPAGTVRRIVALPVPIEKPRPAGMAAGIAA